MDGKLENPGRRGLRLLEGRLRNNHSVAPDPEVRGWLYETAERLCQVIELPRRSRQRLSPAVEDVGPADLMRTRVHVFIDTLRLTVRPEVYG